MHGVEKEFKWDAFARGSFARFEKALAAVAGPLPLAQKWLITDHYLDNPEGDFSRRKIALRVRRQNGRFEATLKTKTALQNGLACRKELTRPLAASGFSAAFKQLQTGAEWEGLALQNLTVKFVLKNRRKTYTVQYKNALCEAALDSYVICAGEKRLAKREIELELKEGSEKDFADLVSALSALSALPPCAKSKVASAEDLLKQ